MIHSTNSEIDTIEFGKKFGETLKSGDVVLLFGELGSGKTTFTKGIAKALGIKRRITSPTFTLMNVYELDDITFAHIDTYRLKKAQDLIDIGAFDYISNPNAITVIEWPEKILDLLKDIKTKSVNFSVDSKTLKRIISI